MTRQKGSKSIYKVNRRDFLKTGSVGISGLVLGFHVGCSSPLPPVATGPFSPNVYLNIRPDGIVEIIAHRSEMGQGVRTSVPMILADELEADWQTIEIVQGLGDSKYGDQNTDGSYSIRMFYQPMRKAGAAARMMLEQAAANHWKVDIGEVKAENGKIVSNSGESLTFSELITPALKLEVPADEDIKLKPESEFKLVNTDVKMVDLPDMIQGKANYGLDVQLPDMKIAVIKRCPVAGGKAVSYDGSKAMEVPGVHKVLELSSAGFPANFTKPVGGIAVVADNTWSALQGRDALEVEWDLGANAGYSTSSFMKEMEKTATEKGNIRREEGDITEAFDKAHTVLESTYKIPHLAHAPMEPPNAAAHFQGETCDIWAPTQHPMWVKGSVAEELGLEAENVNVNVTFLGGGFGRKSKPDFAVEAALLSKEIGGPVKVVWTREDDIQHDFLHAPSVQHIRVALDENKKVTAWNQRSVFPSINGTADASVTEPNDLEIGLGLVDFPFQVPSICIETNQAKTQTRVGWLRSVCNIQHGFAIGSAIDEIAVARGVDPADNILELLGTDRQIPLDETVENFFNYNETVADYPWNTARLRGVVDKVVDKSGWRSPPIEGTAQGICAHRSFLTYVACVVTVKQEAGGGFSIPEIHFAVDCGLAVNPDRVRSQFEGGAVFALSFALKSKITLSNGQVDQDNFDSYELARMTDTPGKVHVHIIESNEKPTGVGEPPVPPVAPALCNALYRLTGKRYRELPLLEV